jgi:hypothetical protein
MPPIPFLWGAKPQITFYPIDKLAVLKFILGFNQHAPGFDDTFHALFQCVPKPRGKDAELALVLVI